MRSLPKPRNQRELESVLSAYCDGRLDAKGEVRLAEMLETDPGARRFYLHYLDLHLELDRRADVSKLVPMPAHNLHITRVWMAVAAVAVLAALGTTALLWQQGKTTAVVADDAPSEGEPIAYISRVDDVDWNYKSTAALGLELISGDSIELNAGKLRVDFFDGTSATIQGPASFALFSATEMELFSGKIAVRSDGPTPGFAVRTPGAVFVDVGTEFALNVVGTEATQLRVIEGEVIATLLSSDDVPLDKRSAVVGEYLTVDRSLGIAEADLDPGEFSEMLDPSILPLRVSADYVASVKRAKPIGYWRFQDAAGDQVPEENGSEHAARALGPLQFEGNENKTIVLDGDGSQRGLFVESPFSGFSSAEYSVELWMNAQRQHPGGLVSFIETGSETLEDARSEQPKHRLMALECMGGERARWSRAPVGKISFNHQSRSRSGSWPGAGERNWSPKGGDPRESGRRKPQHAPDQHEKPEWKDQIDHHHHPKASDNRGRFPGRFSGGKREHESRADSRVFSRKPYSPGTWHHVVAVRESGRVLLYVDGTLEASSEAAPRSEVLNLQVIIGRYSLLSGEFWGRPFSGRLDELAIYDRALSAEEVREHSRLAN